MTRPNYDRTRLDAVEALGRLRKAYLHGIEELAQHCRDEATKANGIARLQRKVAELDDMMNRVGTGLPDVD